MTDTPDIELLERLREATKMRALSYVAVGRDDPETVGRIARPLCDEIADLRALAKEAADRIERLAAALAARDTLWIAWLAREGISYDKGPDNMPKGWGKS